MNNILIQAYCPIARGKHFSHSTVQALAAIHKASPARILIRWSLQKGYIPLPKSDNPERIKENAQVYHFELTDEEMAMLDALDQGKEGALVPQYTECA